MPIYRPGQGVPLARVTEERQPTIILSIPASPPAAGISTTTFVSAPKSRASQASASRPNVLDLLLRCA